MIKNLLLFTILLAASDLKSQALRAMTYNIRYDNPGDAVNRWDNRKHWLTDQIKFHEPTILGIQEGLAHQVAFVDSALSTYSYVGVGRDDGKAKGEFSAIFYKENELRVLQNNTFWLSETPDRVSVGWDAAMERICTYALFEDSQKRQFWVFNTHFDHIGVKAREESARLIISQIEKLSHGGLPVILMGDLNLEPSSAAIRFLSGKMQDTAIAPAWVSFGPPGTWNGFNFEVAPRRRIDYIFVSSGIRVKKYAVLSDSKNQRYPSDHLPVLADIEINQR